jgi:hypothetical protein
MWDATYNHLLSFGVNVIEKPVITRYGMKRFTITDPDGYNLCFQGGGGREVMRGA